LDLRCSADQQVDLTPLSEHPGLRVLWIRRARRFTGLRTFRVLDQLENLVLYQVLPWHTIAFLTHTPQLEALQLGNKLDNLTPIGDLSALRYLLLKGHADQALMSLGPVDQVTQLVLFDPKDKGNLSIAADAFPCVTDMNLSGFDEIDLAPLAVLPLRSLMLQNSSCPDLQPLTRIPGLRQLRLLHMHPDLDLSPLANLELQLVLERGHSYAGRDKLGPGVKISYWR
jgi:hypothetical protein